jgi:hypothetical protein
MQSVVLVCGVAGAGKSWLCRQLTDRYTYIAHDRCWSHPTAKPQDDPSTFRQAQGSGDAAWGPPGSKSTHLETLVRAAKTSGKPVLTEAPFGERKLKEDLEAAGVRVRPVFVIEDAEVIRRRFLSREGSLPSQGVITRLSGLKARAISWDAFWGTSDAVLAHLKAPARPSSVFLGRP